MAADRDKELEELNSDLAQMYARLPETNAMNRMSDEEYEAKFRKQQSQDDFKKQQRAAIEAEVAKGDDRFGDWGSKAKAAKAAGITRPTLDKWIASQKIPPRQVREVTPKGSKKKSYVVNIEEVIRIAAASKAGTQAAVDRADRERLTSIETKLRDAERDRDNYKARMEMAESSLLLIENQQSKVEDLLKEQRDDAKAELKEAKAAADEAQKELERTRSRGLIGRLLNR